MKIAIAINGEGKGHFSRCYALAEVLETAHDIVFFAPQHVCSELASRFPLCTVRMIPFFHFVQHGFSIDYPRTIAQNASLFLNAQPVIGDVARALVREGVDAVLSDFEPFTSRAANTLKIPVLQLNHPGIVMRTGEWSLHSLAARIVSRYMMEGADKTVLCSFFDGDVGPILRSELRDATVSRGNYFVVYQKDRYKEFLKPVLQKSGMHRFRVFPDGTSDYAQALAGSCGLIAPAGHQSISEALALGKPVFVIPVKGQWEQELNARRLRESGFGDYCYFSDLGSRLGHFLKYSDVYFENLVRAKASCTILRNGRRWLCQDDTDSAVAMIERFLWQTVARRRIPVTVSLSA